MGNAKLRRPLPHRDWSYYGVTAEPVRRKEETQKMLIYRVVMKNSYGCTLETRDARNIQDARAQLLDMLNPLVILADGDSFHIEMIEVEDRHPDEPSRFESYQKRYDIDPHML